MVGVIRNSQLALEINPMECVTGCHDNDHDDDDDNYDKWFKVVVRINDIGWFRRSGIGRLRSSDRWPNVSAVPHASTPRCSEVMKSANYRDQSLCLRDSYTLTVYVCVPRCAFHVAHTYTHAHTRTRRHSVSACLPSCNNNNKNINKYNNNNNNIDQDGQTATNLFINTPYT